MVELYLHSLILLHGLVLNLLSIGTKYAEALRCDSELHSGPERRRSAGFLSLSYRAPNGGLSDEFERIWKEAIVV
jgi:hypothetical protein